MRDAWYAMCGAGSMRCCEYPRTPSAEADRGELGGLNSSMFFLSGIELPPTNNLNCSTWDSVCGSLA